MNIVIDKAITDGLVSALASYESLVVEAQNRAAKYQQLADANQMLTIKQACEYLGGISDETLLYYRKQGLDYYKKGRDGVWYRKGDIDDWLATGKVSRHKR